MTTAEAIRRVMESPNVPDSNLEPANIVDVVHALGRAVYRLSEAVTPNIVGGHDEMGGHVESLTEAVMGITGGLARIAESISDLASAVHEHGAGKVNSSVKFTPEMAKIYDRQTPEEQIP